MVIMIIPLMIYRFTRPKERVRGESGRFYGSNMWQGFFVEWVILLVGICILKLRALEYALAEYGDHPDQASTLHYPLTGWMGELFFVGLSESTLATLIWLVACFKIVVSMTWMIVLGRNATMGVAWHRFTAPFNIFFKREASGGTALGAVSPLMLAGRPMTLDDLEDLSEDTALGVGRIDDFSWKARLDLTSCTECGRCQSQCPAWNTEKPLSPKLLITALRDETYAVAGGAEPRPLVGASITDEAAYLTDFGVIDPDVLWSCTSCGACVQQCPVDIEHVDHIIDMRRYQLLVESNFPAELTSLFRGLESAGIRGTCRRSRGWTGPRGSPSRCPCWVRRLSRSMTSSGCSGSAAQVRTRTGRRRQLVLLPSCSTWPTYRSPSSETVRRAPAIRLDGRKRVRVRRACHRQCRDLPRTSDQEGRLHLCALLQHAEERVRRVRREVGGRAPHAIAEPTGARRSTDTDPGCGDPSGRSPITIRASWVDTTRCTRHRGNCSRSSQAPTSSRWSATPSGPSAVARVGRGCGWRSGSAKGSTPTAPPKRSAPARIRSPSDVPSAA